MDGDEFVNDVKRMVRWIERSINEQNWPNISKGIRWKCGGEISNWTSESDIFISRFIVPVESVRWVGGRLNKLKESQIDWFYSSRNVEFFHQNDLKGISFLFSFLVESFLNDRGTLIWNLLILRSIFNRTKKIQRKFQTSDW